MVCTGGAKPAWTDEVNDAVVFDHEAININRRELERDGVPVCKRVTDFASVARGDAGKCQAG
uniref:Uncharacterized protein n=1 Tax=Vibrio genomosp. F6 TaxID=723172 RepID=A0A0H3ZXU5_9VIBR|nr:hypothetical protein [Vibrio genomosp. F6]